MSRVAALLRGVNVGGRNKLPMAALRTSLEALGLAEIETVLQSGNVVFEPGGEVGTLAGRIEWQIAAVFGLDVAVLVRTGPELAAIVAANPFLADEDEPNRLHVVFLDSSPSENAIAGLDSDRSPPDRFAVVGREIFLHTPNGYGRSKLGIDWFERELGARATARNWNTVRRLATLTED
jgi:uncharacterized protein (DUF1697 family)